MYRAVRAIKVILESLKGGELELDTEGHMGMEGRRSLRASRTPGPSRPGVHGLVTRRDGSSWTGWATLIKMMALISGKIISAVQDFSSSGRADGNNFTGRLTYGSHSGQLLAFRTFSSEAAGAAGRGGREDSRRLLPVVQRQHSCLLARACRLPETAPVCFGHSGLFVLR